MQLTLNIIEIVSAVLLVGAILLQNRGSGLGAAFGGTGNTYNVRRGAERTIFLATIVLAIVFLGSSFVDLFF